MSDDDGMNEILAIIKDEEGGEQSATQQKESISIIEEEEEEVEHEGNESTTIIIKPKLKNKNNKFSKFLGHKNKNFENYLAEKSEEDIKLEKLIFGDKEGFFQRLDEQTSSVAKQNNVKKRKPAWIDSEDEDYRIDDVIREKKKNRSFDHLNKDKAYKEYLTTKFERITGKPKWANLDREIESDSDEEILKAAGHLAKTGKSQVLPKTTLQFKKLKDVNRASYSEGSIYDVQFHPRSTAALVTGHSGIASIYSIDGKENEKLHSILFKEFPIKCARLLPDGERAIFGSSKNYYYTYDLMEAKENRIFLKGTMTTLKKFEISNDGKFLAVAGRFGEIHWLDVNSNELLQTLKLNSKCEALQFTMDSQKLLAHSESSNISIFDLRMIRYGKMMHTFIDDGCINGRTLCISPNSQMLATGSNEGVINIYNYNEVFNSVSPQPLKTVYNLTTSISCTKFNHSSEILAVTSEAVTSAVKLIHLPSATVFRNFPGLTAEIGKIRKIEFSPNSGFMAMGNVLKQVPLFRLKHFDNY